MVLRVYSDGYMFKDVCDFINCIHHQYLLLKHTHAQIIPAAATLVIDSIFSSCPQFDFCFIKSIFTLSLCPCVHLGHTSYYNSRHTVC